MTVPNSSAPLPEEPLGWHSLGCEILIIDGPEDTTVRPSPPHLIPFLLAQKERLARYQAMLKQAPPIDKPADTSEGNNRAQG